MVIARKVFRIGVQELCLLNGNFYVTIKNRTYESCGWIPDSLVPVWLKNLGG